MYTVKSPFNTCALEDYDQAIEIDPSFKQAYLSRSNVKFTQKDYVGAIADYDKLIKLDPAVAIYYSARANAKRLKGDLAVAMADYDKAIELDPKNASFYAERGFVKTVQKDFPGATRDYTKAIDLNPTVASYYVNRGDIKNNLKDWIGALEDYNKAIKLDSDISYEVYQNRGFIHFYNKDLTKAVSDFIKSIELDPKLAEAGFLKARETDSEKFPVSDIYNEICFLGSIRGHAQIVLKYCDKAVEEADPEKRALYQDSRGLARAITGDTQGAIADFNAFISWLNTNQLSQDSALQAKRQQWIQLLNSGQDPFTPEVLAELERE